MDFDEAKIAFHIMLCHWCVDWKLEILNCHKDSTKIVKNPSLSQVFHHFAAWQHAHISPSQGGSDGRGQPTASPMLTAFIL